MCRDYWHFRVGCMFYLLSVLLVREQNVLFYVLRAVTRS